MFRRKLKVRLSQDSEARIYDWDQFEELFHVKPLDQLVLEKKPAAAWFLKFFGKKISFESQEVSIKWIDPILGFGVFAERSLQKGAYIGEYGGVLKPFSLLHPPEEQVYSMLYPSLFPFFGAYHIDAAERGNEMRFLNHSYTPNLELKALLDEAGVFHLLFYAKCQIRKGDQLTFDYGEDYWRNRTPPVDI